MKTLQNLAKLPGVTLTKRGLLVDATMAISTINYLVDSGLTQMFDTDWVPFKDRVFVAFRDDLKEVPYEEFVEEEPEEFEMPSEEVTLDVNDVLRETVHEVLQEFEDKIDDEVREGLEEELCSRVSGVLSVPEEPSDEFEEYSEESESEEYSEESESEEYSEESNSEESNSEESESEESESEESFISSLINAVSGAGAYYRIFLEGDSGSSSVVVQVEDNDLAEEVKQKISDELEKLGYGDFVGEWHLEEVDGSGDVYWVLRSVGSLEDGVVRKVKHGKKKIEVEKPVGKASLEQTENLTRARKKAHTVSAERERRRSNDVRKRSGW